jgi:hypothetical protein
MPSCSSGFFLSSFCLVASLLLFLVTQFEERDAMIRF